MGTVKTTKICPICKKQVYITLGKDPSKCHEGDVYTPAGVRVLTSKGYCEYCYNKMNKDKD